jgi:hypothetical protein
MKCQQLHTDGQSLEKTNDSKNEMAVTLETKCPYHEMPEVTHGMSVTGKNERVSRSSLKNSTADI